MNTDQNFSDYDFIRHFIQNAPQIMWLLGAGTSRTAGLLTASDIIWDLKRSYYCRHENQDIKSHDINSPAIKQKIQAYADSQGFPPANDPKEYSFYFELAFGTDYAEQQKYILHKLAPEKVALNVGHRAFAALIEMGLARVAFTTNFDDVIETAYAAVSHKSLNTFHIEGSYAALDALNAERFPIYAKMHGDFRYRSIKNLSSDLLHNDEQIRKCFLTAANRFGLVVSGYSGRDANVMEMLEAALKQSNPFPQGLFWTTTAHAEVSGRVKEFIAQAIARGINAHVVEVGTFDTMLSRIWRQLENKPHELESRVRTVIANKVAIPQPPAGGRYPVLRTNAFAITECPTSCGKLIHRGSMTFKDVTDKEHEHRPDAVISFTDNVLFWGDADEVTSMFSSDKVDHVEVYTFNNPPLEIAASTAIKSLFEKGLAKSLCHQKPLVLRRRGATQFAVVKRDEISNPIFGPLKLAIGYQGKPAPISGSVPGLGTTIWAEALSIKLEERDGNLWLLLRPDIWVTPLSAREDATVFLKQRRARRYNAQASAILDAWIKILFGETKSGDVVRVSCFTGKSYSPSFSLNSRTAYSHGAGQ